MLDGAPLRDVDNIRVLESIVQIGDAGCLFTDLNAMVVAHLYQVPLENNSCQGTCGSRELVLCKLCGCV